MKYKLGFLFTFKEKVLVYFLRKPYNDKHFDLKSLKQLCGKTIYFASKYGNFPDATLASYLQVSIKYVLI